jgi:uncharacterized membrane protein
MRDHATTTVAGRTAVSLDAQNPRPAAGPAFAGDRRPADPSVVPRSARLLVAGIVCAVLGAAVMALGWMSSLQHGVVGDPGADPGRAPVILGALLALAGIALLVVGVWRLASSIDYLAQREKDREYGGTQ